MSSNDPNQTLYIKGLPEKVRVEEIKESLYTLFLSYGEILDIVIMKKDKMRGQAFVVFEDIAAATTALKSLNGFSFYDKNITIQYARSKSDAVAKLDGTYKPKLSAEDIKRKAASAAAMSATKRQKSSDSDSDSEDASMDE
ncbi:putative U1 small nuclear ribonucleoprotein A [Umbelopsis sp. PMI_123]|nr:putative U1 small nuclear ribonucleoprotein A [Umbelopsis sp. PMI_123]